MKKAYFICFLFFLKQANAPFWFNQENLEPTSILKDKLENTFKEIIQSSNPKNFLLHFKTQLKSKDQQFDNLNFQSALIKMTLAFHKAHPTERKSDDTKQKLINILLDLHDKKNSALTEVISSEAESMNLEETKEWNKFIDKELERIISKNRKIKFYKNKKITYPKTDIKTENIIPEAEKSFLESSLSERKEKALEKEKQRESEFNNIFNSLKNEISNYSSITRKSNLFHEYIDTFISKNISENQYLLSLDEFKKLLVKIDLKEFNNNLDSDSIKNNLDSLKTINVINSYINNRKDEIQNITQHNVTEYLFNNVYSPWKKYMPKNPFNNVYSPWKKYMPKNPSKALFLYNFKYKNPYNSDFLNAKSLHKYYNPSSSLKSPAEKYLNHQNKKRVHFFDNQPSTKTQ